MNKLSVKKGDAEISLEGDHKFIEKYLRRFGGVLGINDPGQKSSVPPAIVKANRVASEGGSLRDLYTEKAPSTHYDKIALFAYYLTDTGKKEFTENDIKDCYIELRKVTKQPGNLRITLQDTKRHTRYVKHEKKGFYSLTSTGMNHVLHELPEGPKK